jgi:hypothetical protein
MRVLVVHQNFPGLFGHLVTACWASRPGWDVRALGRHPAPGLPGFNKLLRYRLARQSQTRQHPYLRQMETATLHGQAAARAMLQLRASGFSHDVILAHPGWGETLYAKDVYPDARLVHFCEWYYSANGADLGFAPEFPLSFDDRARIRTWNVLHTLNRTNCDAAVTPTQWQRSWHPEGFQTRITVQHKGIARELLGPDLKAGLTTSERSYVASRRHGRRVSGAQPGTSSGLPRPYAGPGADPETSRAMPAHRRLRAAPVRFCQRGGRCFDKGFYASRGDA